MAGHLSGGADDQTEVSLMRNGDYNKLLTAVFSEVRSASEVMSALIMASNMRDLKERLGKMIERVGIEPFQKAVGK